MRGDVRFDLGDDEWLILHKHWGSISLEPSPVALSFLVPSSCRQIAAALIAMADEVEHEERTHGLPA